MTKIHGGAPGEVAEEFFYLDDDGNKQDADLHNPILIAEPIDEKIMGPIRERHRMSHWDERARVQKKANWERAKKKAQELLRDFNPSQPRDEDGKWTSGGSAGVPGYKPGVRGRGNVEVNKRRDEWVAASNIKTIDDVIKAAPIAQKAFAETGRRIAEEMGITFKDPGPKTHRLNKETGKLEINAKGIERTKQKIAERKGLTARVTDTARGAFVLTHPDQSDAVIAKLSITHEVLAEPWRTIKDTYYTDRALLFRDRATGLIGEVQITETAMLEAKSKLGGHEMYEESRVMTDDNPRKAELTAKMKALYGGVLDSYKGTDWEVVDGRGRG